MDHAEAVARFDAAIAFANGPDQAYRALQELVSATVGAKLFTVTAVDIEHDVIRRAYTSNPEDYPLSGTKPINYGPWFDTMNTRRSFFVANTIEDIAPVFFDHQLIKSLGCQSIVNMPVIIGGSLVAIVNMLNVAEYYTPERLQMIRDLISIPAKLVVLLAT